MYRGMGICARHCGLRPHEGKGEGVLWVGFHPGWRWNFCCRGRWRHTWGMAMGFQPGAAFFFGCIVPGVSRFWPMGGQVAPQGVHAHQPEVLATGQAAPPAGAGAAVQVAIRDGGTVTDWTQWGDPDPALGPGRFVAAERAWATGGEVVLNERNGRAGELRGAATFAEAVAADVMDGAVHQDEVMYSTDRDLGRWDGRGEGFTEDAADA